MPWFHALVPDHTADLERLDFWLNVIHLAIVLFVSLGWAIRPLRKAHLITVLIVWVSWIAIGFYVGNPGYCILTDWHWRVKQAIGESKLPPSYLAYLYTEISGREANSRIISWIAAVILIAATFLSIRLNIRRRTGR